MNAKYTPGPWKVGNGRKPDLYMGWNTVLGTFDDGEKFVLCQTNHHYEEASKANAILIAAAPEMVDALKMCIDALYEAMDIAPLDRMPGKATSAIQQAQYVLNKATGSEI